MDEVEPNVPEVVHEESKISPKKSPETSRSVSPIDTSTAPVVLAYPKHVEMLPISPEGDRRNDTRFFDKKSRKP